MAWNYWITKYNNTATHDQLTDNPKTPQGERPSYKMNPPTTYVPRLENFPDITEPARRTATKFLPISSTYNNVSRTHLALV